MTRLPNTPSHLPSGPFKWSLEQWNAAKDEVRQLLIERAKVRGMIPYSELVAQIDSIELEARDVRFFSLLGEISMEEHREGRPLLSVLVVHKAGDMQPGPGFFELAKGLGRNTDDILACWIDEFQKVHAFWSN